LAFLELQLLQNFDTYFPIQNFKTLTSKSFQGRGTNGMNELKVSRGWFWSGGEIICNIAFKQKKISLYCLSNSAKDSF
jgi:hypothetical protein